jgi:hypothetical protein
MSRSNFKNAEEFFENPCPVQTCPSMTGEIKEMLWK